MNFRREGSGYLRVGHRGAAALAPPNSLAGLDAALAAGLDGVEVDVVEANRQVVLAHSLGEHAPDAPTLDEALAVLAERGGPDVFVDVDVKGWGFEGQILDALHRQGFLDRALVSSFFFRTLRAMRRLDPEVALAVSYPYDRLRVTARGVPERAIATGLSAMRRVLPLRIGRLLARSGAGVATLHHLVISRSLVERCHALGVPVLAWTVNDAVALARVVELGVDGVITDDPRIFPAR